MIMNEMYWITRLDGLLVAFVVPMAILLFIATLSAIFYFDVTYASDDERKGYRKRAIIWREVLDFYF